jgi:hypothetical protein
MIDYLKSPFRRASGLPHATLGASKAPLASVKQFVTAEFQNRCNAWDESIGSRDDQV